MSQQFTNVRLLSGVPFDNTYAHTKSHVSLSAQQSYFTSFATRSGANYSYQRAENVFRADYSLDSLLDVNYLMYQNADFNNKWFYAFVTQLEWKSVGTTFVHFEIDVLQTWWFDFQFKSSYVVREHVPRYTNNIPSINTIDEGLDYGTDYDLVFASNFHPTGVNFVVLVCSEALGTGNVGTEKGGAIVGVPSSHSYYFFPVSLGGEVYDVSIDGSSGSNESLGTFRDYMAMIATKEPFLNRVITAYVTSYVGLNFDVDRTNKVVSFTNTNTAKLGRVDYMSDVSGENKRYSMFSVNEITSFQTKTITVTADVYSNFTNHLTSFETKAYMFPYCLIEITDMKGHILTLRPEYLQNNTLELKVRGGLGISNKVSVTPANYNTDVGGADLYLADFSLIDTDPTEVGVNVDYASAIYQGQKNSLMAQEQNIYNTAGHQYGNTLMSTFGALSSALASGNPFVGLTNIMGSGQQLNNSVMEKENALNLLSGKIKDIDNVPATVKQMGANASFSYGNFHNEYYVRYKMIKPEYFNRLSRYFSFYGNKKLDFKIPNLSTRRYWNYVQTKSSNIVGTMNATALTKIKEIFDAGVTIWHDNDVMNYDRQNTEV